MIRFTLQSCPFGYIVKNVRKYSTRETSFKYKAAVLEKAEGTQDQSESGKDHEGIDQF